MAPVLDRCGPLAAYARNTFRPMLRESSSSKSDRRCVVLILCRVEPPTRASPFEFSTEGVSQAFRLQVPNPTMHPQRFQY
eukprot:2759504-Rhodomonas_salina.3